MNTIETRRLSSLATHFTSRESFAAPIAVAVLATTMTSGAWAQSSGGGDSTNRPSSVLEEVVVTAEKRDSTVQKTPISITAVSGAELEARGVSDFTSLARETPGISFKSSGPGQTEFAMRGLTSSAGISPTVGFYVDETALSAPTKSAQGKMVIDPNLYDLQRVEVLRGPQGTLYGSGSMGGTIKLITNPPELDGFSGSVQAIGSGTQDGGFNSGVNAMLNLPIAHDVAALRIVGTDKRVEGWVDRVVLNPFPLPANSAERGDMTAAPVERRIEDANSQHLQAARASLLVKPNDRLAIKPGFMYQRISMDGLSLLDDPPGRSAHYQPFDVDEPFADKFTLSTAVISYGFDSFDVTSSTSYWERELHQTQDYMEGVVRGLGLPSYYIGGGGVGAGDATETLDGDEFSQEIRFASTGEGRLRWLVGGYYSDYSAHREFYSVVPGFAPLFGTDIVAITDNDLTLKQKALFGEASYEITDRLTATVGLRWYSYKSDGIEVGSGLVTAAGGSGSVTTRNNASNDGYNPKFNLAYALSDDTLLYVTAAKGFRPGSGNIPLPLTGPSECLTSLQALGLSGAPRQYDPDTVWSYEVGEKVRLLDGRVTLNSSLYLQRWENVQQQVALNCGYAFTSNAGSAEAYGAEVEIAAKLAPALTLTQNVGYTHATFTESVLAADIAKGQKLLHVPDFTATTSATYRTPVSATYDFVGRASFSYVGPRQDLTFARNDLPSYSLVNARVALDSGVTSISLFVDNLTDRRALLTNINSLAINAESVNRVATTLPRTIGIDVNRRF